VLRPLKNKIHAIAPELQFWGYEGGNVLAAVAGAGGFIAFYNDLRSVGDVPLHDLSAGIVGAFTSYPDVLVTTGLALIVLLTVTLGGLFGTTLGPAVKLWIDRVAAVCGILLAAGCGGGACRLWAQLVVRCWIVDASDPDRAHRYLCDFCQSDDLSGWDFCLRRFCRTCRLVGALEEGHRLDGFHPTRKRQQLKRQNQRQSENR